MIERCHHRDCRLSGVRQTANLTPSAPNGKGKVSVESERRSPNCRGESPKEEMTAETRSLLQRLRELDFSIMDTVLYLDAYPRCREALDYYHKLLGERASLLNALAKSGAPVTHFENASRDTWEWTNGPWPWESAAN